MRRRRFLLLLALPLVLAAGCLPRPDFSPDGRRIALFWKVAGHDESLFVVDADGAHLRPVPDSQDALISRWSPDGKWLLFAGGDSNLRIADMTTGKTRLLDANGAQDFAWREDGRRFAALRKNKNSKLRLSYYDGTDATQETQRVALPVENASDSGPLRWLPGTDNLAFVGENRIAKNGGSDLQTDVYAVEAGLVETITKTHDVMGMGLTPDGKTLMWARRAKNPKYVPPTLYAFDLQKRTVARLPFAVPKALWTTEAVAFAPDGTHLALTVSRPLPQDKDAVAFAVWTARRNGTNVNLAYSGKGRSGNTMADLPLPTWSRDSRRLLLLTVGSQAASYRVYDADGGAETKLPLPALPKE